MPTIFGLDNVATPISPPKGQNDMYPAIKYVVKFEKVIEIDDGNVPFPVEGLFYPHTQC